MGDNMRDQSRQSRRPDSSGWLCWAHWPLVSFLRRAATSRRYLRWHRLHYQHHYSPLSHGFRLNFTASKAPTLRSRPSNLDRVCGEGPSLLATPLLLPVTLLHSDAVTTHQLNFTASLI